MPAQLASAVGNSLDGDKLQTVLAAVLAHGMDDPDRAVALLAAMVALPRGDVNVLFLSRADRAGACWFRRGPSSSLAPRARAR